MSKRIIVIVAATNAPGRSLVRAIANDSTGLLAARAMASDLGTESARTMAALGVEVVAGNVVAGRALKKAFTDAHGAFYFRDAAEHPGLRRELAEARAMALAAKDADLKHVVWAAVGDIKPEIAGVFHSLGLPITLLHVAGNPNEPLRKQIAEEIGRGAHEILRTGTHVGEALSINPANLPGASDPILDEPVQERIARSRKALIVVPLIGVLAALAVAYFQWSRMGERVGDHAGEEEAAAPAAQPATTTGALPAPPPVVDAAQAAQAAPAAHVPPVVAQKEEPPLSEPTATAKWEAERAAVMMKKKKGPAAAAASTKHRAPVAHVRHRRRGRAERDRSDVAASSPTPSSGDSGGAPEPAAPAPVAQPPVKEPAAAAPPAATASRAREAPATPSSPASPPPPASQASRAREAPGGAPAPAPGTVDPRKVTAAVRAHADEVRACFDRAVMERSDLHGRLTVHAAIDPSGHVLSLSPVSTIDGGGRLEACVASAFRTWTFPTPAGGVKGNITYSFTFE